MTVTGVDLGADLRMPDLLAHPGERVAIDAGDGALTSEVLGCIAGLPTSRVGKVVVNGREVALLNPAERQSLLGYAARGSVLANVIRDEPPLLVLDRHDAGMAPDDRSILRATVEGYPGVVILASDDPLLLALASRVWRPDGLRPASSLHERARRRTNSAS